MLTNLNYVPKSARKDFEHSLKKGGTLSVRDINAGAMRNTLNDRTTSLTKTHSESKLLVNAYSNSKLIPTSNQMMKRLVNFSLEKQLDKG